VDDVAGAVLAHLHANAGLTAGQLAATLGVAEADVEAATAALLADGHLERQDDRLVPTGASHPTPGVFTAGERADAAPVEIDYPDNP
jgi:hypothetical protein